MTATDDTRNESESASSTETSSMEASGTKLPDANEIATDDATTPSVHTMSAESIAEESGKRSKMLGYGIGAFSISLGLAEIIAPRAIARLMGIRPTASTTTMMRIFGAREVAAGIGMLMQPQRPEWAWARVAGDVVDFAALTYASKGQKNNRARLRVAAAATIGIGVLDLARARQLGPRIKPRAERHFGDEAVDVPADTELPRAVDRLADVAAEAMKEDSKSTHATRDEWYNNELANERSTF